MGHSMGAYGTWSIAMNHPEIFAALGPISGGGIPAGMVKIRHIPAYVVHGDDDRTVSVTQSRNMVEAGKKAGAEIVYVEVTGGSPVGVAAPGFEVGRAPPYPPRPSPERRTASVTQSRKMAEAAKKALPEIVYVEVPGGSHVGVAAPAF